MIVLCSGEISDKHLDAMVLLAQQLDARGHHVVIDERFLPEGIARQVTYEIAPFVAELTHEAPSVLVVVGAQAISDEALAVLSQIKPNAETSVWGIGRFDTLQDQIQGRNRIAYATGQEPQILDLSARKEHVTYEETLSPLLTGIRAAPVDALSQALRILIYIPFDEDDDGDALLSTISDLSALHFSPNFRLHVLTTSKGKDHIGKSRASWSSVFSYLELPPQSLVTHFDVLVFCGSGLPGQRMADLSLNAMGAGKVVVDCTQAGAFSVGGAPVLRGPTDPKALVSYLRDAVEKNCAEIGNRTVQSDWLQNYDVAKFEQRLNLQPDRAAPTDRTPRRVIFPTNGNGLGHAQRCALIAETVNSDTPQMFAAFPSCVTFLRNRGFQCVPMVSRSADHAEDHAADIVNYLRLRQVLSAGDQLVFDGGFVFDSVYRMVSALDLSATWIRRGLWRPGQINRAALERERVFKHVIVPSEAFAELNTDYSDGAHVHKVGPVVQTSPWTEADRHSLRERLSVEYDRSIDTLVVSMLGGGVASNRTAQTQLLASLFEEQDNCLHLIVTWPNAIIDSALFGWKNSSVVRTARAMDLARAADFCVSAAGYNSFHELIYAKVPTLFIPQSAPYLDDQERRARAAAERQLAVYVRDEALLKLEREVRALLGSGKRAELASALGAAKLPDPGTMAAARIIEKG